MAGFETRCRNHRFEQASLVLRAAPDEDMGLEPVMVDCIESEEGEIPQACGIVIHTDGLCEPVNPGGIATAAWVAKRRGKVLGTGCRVVAVGKGTTGNMAEYCAIIDGLQWAADRGLMGVEVRSDSQTCVGQICGLWQVRSPALQALCARAQDLVARTRASLVWVPRDQNLEADALSVRAWEGYTGNRLAKRYGKNLRAKRWRRRRAPQKQAPVSARTATEGRPGEGASDA